MISTGRLIQLLIILVFLFLFKSTFIALTRLDFVIVSTLASILIIGLIATGTLGYRFKYQTLVPSLIFLVLLLYGFIQVVFVDAEITVYLELLGLAVFFYIGYFFAEYVDSYAYRFLSIFVLLECVALILYRGYIFDSGQNYLLLATPIVVTLIFQSFRLQQTRSLTGFIVIFILLFASLNLQSRTTFIFELVFICIFAFAFWPKATSILTFLGMLFVGYIGSKASSAFFEGFPVVVRLLSEGLESSSRVNTLREYFSGFEDFYITGIGMGRTPELFSDSLVFYPHNVLLEILSEFGLLGLPLILFFLVVFTLGLMRYKNSSMMMRVNITIFVFLFIVFNKSFSFYDAYPLLFYTGVVYRYLMTTALEIGEDRRLVYNA